MLDTLLPFLAGVCTGVLLLLWRCDALRERLEAAHRDERERWEAERLKLVAALAPGVGLVEPERRTRRAWTDAEEASWEAARVRDGQQQ